MRFFRTIALYTGCNDTLAPLPQPKLKVAQYNQTYCRKVKSISAMDFQYFYFVSIFTIFLILSNKNAQIHKNRTQSTLFICFFTALYGFYGISVYWSWKPLVLPFFWYLTFDLLTIGHKMAIISMTLSAEKNQKSAWCHIVLYPLF